MAARAEPRFTRDVDLAVGVADEADAEGLVWELRRLGYRPIATVAHETLKRLATVRLGSPEGPVVDLLFASSGIEPEVIARATPVDVMEVGSVLVTRAEELLSMKVLSMSKRRRQDRVDALSLLEMADVDLHAVRQNLALIAERGFHRDQDLLAKLQGCSTRLPRRTDLTMTPPSTRSGRGEWPRSSLSGHYGRTDGMLQRHAPRPLARPGEEEEDLGR